MNQATVPGKIILFGEHAVVYARPAIAVPVTQLWAKASLMKNETLGFRIIAPDLERDYYLADAHPNDPLVAIIEATLQKLARPIPDGIQLHVSATIPLGRGLGSGAAVSTAIVRALAKFYDHSLSPIEISTLVYEVEKLHHGTPSGIDNTVIAFEQPVYFIRGRPIQHIKTKHSFTLVIADTGIIAPTHQVVGGVRARWQADSSRYEGYFDEIGAIAQHAKMIIEQGRIGVSALGKLMNENQEILTTIGVSSPALAHLVEVARQAGAMGAKLSGAGQGGNIIALVDPAEANRVAQALESAGAVETVVTTVV
jgi:mevalonate kinase